MTTIRIDTVRICPRLPTKGPHNVGPHGDGVKRQMALRRRRAAPRDGAFQRVLLSSRLAQRRRLRPCAQEAVMSDHASNIAGRLDRRSFLKRTGVAGAAAVIASRLPAPGHAGAQDMTVRPDPAAKRGGTLRYAVHNAPAHFDVHQSGTVANIGPQSPMYDTLLRRSPKDGQTIIPDLAQRWDISADGKKYTFYLRKGVKFHDGADFTAEDVKATYERIARPPKGVVIPRTPLFATVGDIVAVDPHTIEFRLTEARPKAYMLGPVASGSNIIARKTQ